MNSDDGSGNILGVIDDLVDPRDTLSNVHAGDACEMESFQGHLCCRLTNTLRSECPDGFPWLHDAFVHLLDVHLKEIIQMQVSYPVETVPQILLISSIFDLDPLIVLFKCPSLLIEMILNIRESFLQESLLKAHY